MPSGSSCATAPGTVRFCGAGGGVGAGVGSWYAAPPDLSEPGVCAEAASRQDQN